MKEEHNHVDISSYMHSIWGTEIKGGQFNSASIPALDLPVDTLDLQTRAAAYDCLSRPPNTYRQVCCDAGHRLYVSSLADVVSRSVIPYR